MGKKLTSRRATSPRGKGEAGLPMQGTQAEATNSKRTRLMRLVDWLNPDRQSVPVQCRLLLEPLEARQLMAGDVDLTIPDLSSLTTAEANSAFVSSASGSSQRTPQGEPARDLVAFARQLTDRGVIFFGAIWCTFCNQQKALFQDGQEYLPFREVTNPDRTRNQLGIQEGITIYPTWRFPGQLNTTLFNQTASNIGFTIDPANISQGPADFEIKGLLPLDLIAVAANVSIPITDRPSLRPIGNQSVQIGSPLMVPIDAYNPDGSPLTISVTSSNPSLVEARILDGNRSLRLNVQNWGDMVFELFEGLAPLPTSRIIQLAQNGFFNRTASNQIIFHRVINNFVIQGGDPTGTGTGGSTLGTIDDQFHLDLQHNRTGLLSYAKSGDDTNDSQFFITEGPTRHLDFNHSIFGILVEGESVREGISNTPVGASDRPTTPVVIDTASVFNDLENGVLQLRAVGNQTGTANITVTVTNRDGRTATEVFQVNVIQDNVNTPPFLGPITPPAPVAVGQPIRIPLTSSDVEGDAVTYFARRIGSVNYTTSVDQATRTVTVTPPAGFSGEFDVLVGVNQPSGLTFAGAEDTQTVRVVVNAGAPTAVDLLPVSDTGASNSDNITNASSLQFTVSGVTPGATVVLRSGTTDLGQAIVGTGQTTATITTTALTPLGSGVRSITAIQRISGTDSAASAPLSVTIDTVSPVQSTTSVPNGAIVNESYLVDLAHPEEGQGLTYSLLASPFGLTVDGVSGLVRWTPTSAQLGAQSFTVSLTDLAGNVTNQTFNVNVSETASAIIRLEATNLSGEEISTLATGQEFNLVLYVQDRRGITAQGVFSAYIDLLYNSQLVELVGTSPITYDGFFSTARTGNTTTAGLIDELGATGSSLTPPGSSEQRLASIRLRGTRPGLAAFTMNPSDDSGTPFLVYGSNDPVPNNRISFRGTTLTVTSGFRATNDTFNIDEDVTNFNMNVLSNDQAASGTTLTIRRIGQAPANGVATIATDNRSIQFTPNRNFNGADQFTYVVADGAGSEQTATVTVGVQPVNDAPTGANDSIQIAVGSTNNVIDVLANDSIAPDSGETLRVSQVGSTSNGGTVTIQASGAHVVYTPRTGFRGTDTFTYTLTDRPTGGLTATATVTVHVGEVNNPPTVVGESFTLNRGAAAADYNTISNDTPSSPTLTLSVTSVGVPSQGGTASAIPTGIRYQPAANFVGTETVTYTVRDSRGAQAVGTATFIVSGANDPPVAVNDSQRIVRESGATPILVLENDTPAGLTISAVGTPTAGGRVTISSNNTFVLYTPPSPTFEGSDSFSYTVRDSQGQTATATVFVQVVEYVVRSFMVDVEAGIHRFRLADNLLTLTGTDFTGGTVRTSGVNRGELFEFADQAPGSYLVSVPEIPFLVGGNGTEQLSFESRADDGNATRTLELGSLDPRYISIRDFVTTTPQQSVLVALRRGQAFTWISEAPDLGGISSPSVSLSQDGTQVTITGNRGSDRVTATLPVGTNLVQQRGTDGDFFLMRIAVGNSLVSYQTVTPTSGSGEPNSAAENASGASTVIAAGEPSDAVIAASGGAIATSLLGNSLFTTEEEEPEPPVLANEARTATVLEPISNRQTEDEPQSEAISFADDQSESTSAVEALDELFGMLG